MNALDNVIAIISQAESPTLSLSPESRQRVNPKWSMVAHVFVNMLRQDAVIPRLAQARSLDDLKAILFVDHYVSRIRCAIFRQHLQELLANPAVPLAAIESYAALSFAYNAIWPASPTAAVDKDQVLYSVEAAAVQLGLPVEMLLPAIQAGEVTAGIYLTRAEVERLQDRL